MRIGIDIRLQNETGVGRYIRNLVRLLPKLAPSHEFVFLNPPFHWHSLDEQLKMPSYLSKQNLDLVHFPYFNVPLFYNKPFVVTIHDLIINDLDTGRASTLSFPFYKLKRFGYHLTVSHAIYMSKAIIVPSNATKNEVKRHYPRVRGDKIYATYEAADEINTKQYHPSSLPLKSKQFLLYVGNAYPHKNVDLLVDAFADVKSSRLSLVLVGKKSFFYDKLQQYVNAKYPKLPIFFTGELSDNELSWLYQKALGLVVPSLMEGFGLPALEALSVGTPVIASDIPALHEICQRAALYFNPRKKQELTKAIINLNHYKENPLITKNIVAGKIRAQTFSWEKMVRETVEIYERCFSVRQS